MKSVAVLAALCLAAGTAAADEHAGDPPAATSDHRTAWRGVFVTSVAVVVASGGMWFYGAHESEASTEPPGTTMATADVSDRGQTFSRIGLVGVGVGSTVAMVALYKGFIQSQGRESSTKVASRKHPRTLVVTPIVSSEGGGATLRLDW